MDHMAKVTRKAKEDVKTESLRLRMTKREKKAFAAAADKANRSVSDWLRDLGRRKAGLSA